MTNDSNPYCTALGIPVPRLEDARSSPDANYYSLLLVALLERGGSCRAYAISLRDLLRFDSFLPMPCASSPVRFSVDDDCAPIVPRELDTRIPRVRPTA